jgi:hypothetical protein
MFPLGALAMLLSLAGCAYPNPAHVAALNALVGKSETDLVRAYGVPVRTYATGGEKFLSYSMSRIETIPGDPGFYPYGFGFGYGYGFGGFGAVGGFPPEIVQRDCTTTFELKDGIVLHWTLRGNDC